jgi:hypothetical protein
MSLSDLAMSNLDQNLTLLTTLSPEKLKMLIDILDHMEYHEGVLKMNRDFQLECTGDIRAFSDKEILLQSNTNKINPKTGDVFVINLNPDIGISEK